MYWRRYLLMFLAVATGAAQAESWTHVTYAANGAEVAVDRETLEAKDGWVRVWVRYDYTTVRTEKNRALVLQQEFNCNGKYARIISSTFYDPYGKAASKDDRASDYAEVKPGSVNDGIGKTACAIGAAQESAAPR